MKLKMIIFIGILTGVSFQSCKKETASQNEAAIQYTAEELLTMEEWKMTFYSFTIYGETYDYDQSDFDECEIDDRLLFSVDHKLIPELGAVKCDTNEVQTMERGMWSINEDHSILILTDHFPDYSFDVFSGVFNDAIVQFEIVSLSADKMVIENTEFNQNFGTEVNSIYTFKH